MPETPIWHPCQGVEAVFSTYPVVALCLPPANFSNRFAVKHTIHNDILHLTMLAIDITRALNLSMNPHSSTVQRRYRDGNELTSTQSFRASDLLLISFAAQEAYRRLMEENQKS